MRAVHLAGDEFILECGEGLGDLLLAGRAHTELTARDAVRFQELKLCVAEFNRPVDVEVVVGLLG